MSLVVDVIAVSLDSVTPQMGTNSLYSGKVKVALQPQGGTNFGELQMEVPFENAGSLNQGVTWALNSLKGYGDDLVHAAAMAINQYQ